MNFLTYCHLLPTVPLCPRLLTTRKQKTSSAPLLCVGTVAMYWSGHWQPARPGGLRVTSADVLRTYMFSIGDVYCIVRGLKKLKKTVLLCNIYIWGIL